MGGQFYKFLRLLIYLAFQKNVNICNTIVSLFIQNGVQQKYDYVLVTWS